MKGDYAIRKGTFLKKRKLGKSGIEVSALGLGCLEIGGRWTQLGEDIHFGKVSDAESIRAIQWALDQEINFFDTAANYGAGHSKQLLGKAIADRRDEAIITTKFGYQVNEKTKSVTYYGNDPNSDEVASHIHQDCLASLRRLNTDYIDLYLFHINEYSPVKAVTVRDMLEDLVSEGLIRFYGWSTDNPEGARVFAQGKYCVAIEYTLNVILDAPDMLAICDEFDQASISRGPLGMGLLTGKYSHNPKFAKNDWRNNKFFQSAFIQPILHNLDSIRDILTSDERTLAQGTLAWIWARSMRNIPIPGFRTLTQVQENVESLEFGPLSSEHVQQIDEILGRLVA